MLGALNPLRAVISGENMGYVFLFSVFDMSRTLLSNLYPNNYFSNFRLPLNDDIAREMELSE